MIAASLLVVAVTATYASLAMLSLSVSAPSAIVNAASSVKNYAGHVGWQNPKLPDLGVTVQALTGSDFGSPAALTSLVDFGSTTGGGPIHRVVSIHNTGAKPLHLEARVTGPEVLGVSAAFRGGGNTVLVKPHGRAYVTLASNPEYAGVISGTLAISVPNSSVTPTYVPITGSQAAYAPGAVTATPAAGGAVDLSWAPSPSHGVVGYVVQSSTTPGGPFNSVGTLTTGTTAVEQTGTNATTFYYRVVAVADGVTRPVNSAPGGVGSAVTDSEGPDTPSQFSALPQYINQADVGTFNFNVVLPQSSSQNDKVTVTLSTASNGTTLTQTEPGGAGPVNVEFPEASTLAEGPVIVTAVATDSVGNPSQPLMATITKDTIPPPALESVQPPEMITSLNQAAVPVLVTSDPTDVGYGIVVTLTEGSQTATSGAAVLAPQGGGQIVIPVDATNLGDGSATVSATVTDEAGNTATTSGGTVTINTQGPGSPTLFQVDPGPDNAADVINSFSQTAVMIDAQFAQPTDAVSAILTIDHGAPISAISVNGSTDISFGPLDLSDLPDGPVRLKLTLTDTNGNITIARDTATKTTVGPSAPTSVGVPAGPSNPAGYVNSGTQSAATIVASFDAPTDPADQITLNVDGDQLATQSGGSDQATWTADLSNLPDGTLPITGTITDAYGNVTNFNGSLIKDTQAPPAPVAANVVGPPLNTITLQDASCVNVAVAFNVAVDPSDNVTVTLTDSDGTTVQGSAQAGNGLVTVGCIDASSLAAGQITVSVTVTDVAGNSTSSPGTTATKLPACDHHHHGGGGKGSGGGGGGGTDG